MLDVKGKTELMGKSRCNLANASVALKMRARLLKTFDPEHSGIHHLTEYSEKYAVVHYIDYSPTSRTKSCL